ncbi:16S rRNA (guanine(966)-N(2))-methyltransferase RsmD [Roseomonas sp. BN140053]|uniref:16S rRNA (guanine(966)-N(2))-methyltransferase RsmD n=1 Tax=Roseomonas sp. BN140053 TaxID=3391898 RepID=UPI0039E93903
MRIVAGRWRGRRLEAPPGEATRPTADRVRQALFDMLWHAPWAGRERVEGATVLDAFAGTGAMGLEALSRGAARATFLENDRAALAALRSNLETCLGAGAARGGGPARILSGDATKPPRADAPCGLIFLDPPYGQELGATALAALRGAGWVAPGAVACLELGRTEAAPELPGWESVAERAHGAARLLVLRDAG